MPVDGIDGTELKGLQPLEVCFGDISTVVKPAEHGIRLHQDSLPHLDPKSEIDQKLTVPFLTSPPGLIRRFADCDLTGDCRIHEILSPDSELPSGSSLPGDSILVQPPKSQSSGSKFQSHLFQSLKGVASADQNWNGSSSSLRMEFKPLKDIFHLFGKAQLVTRSSFLGK